MRALGAGGSGQLDWDPPATNVGRDAPSRPSAAAHEVVETGERVLAPLLKWPGGKRALARQIVDRFPSGFSTYYEPFFGGGAVFFALTPLSAVITDVNEELINCYQMVRDEPEALISVLGGFRNSKDEYYRMRDYRPRNEIRRAARFIYLTRLSFNGIHRVNLRGKFNVPYGHKTHVAVVDEIAIWEASIALSTARIMVADFEAATSLAGRGDLVYFDPPYTVAHANNGFVKYNENIFSWSDQVRLAEVAHALHLRGCTVIVSNADHKSVRDLYPAAETDTLERFSRMAASSEFRKPITECLFVMNGENGLA